MSADLKHPTTVLGMVNAAASFVAQIRYALVANDTSRAIFAVEQAEQLLFNATSKIEENKLATKLKKPPEPAKCQFCGKTPEEISGYLLHVNWFETEGVWECRPSCNKSTQ